MSAFDAAALQRVIASAVKELAEHGVFMRCDICDNQQTDNDSMEYQTSYELARALLTMPDGLAVVATPVFDMPGRWQTLPVDARPRHIGGQDCVVFGGGEPSGPLPPPANDQSACRVVWTTQELAVINDLARMKDVTPVAILRQALRAYQLATVTAQQTL